MKFRTSVELGGKTATGLHVPEAVVTGLEAGKRPAVRVTVAGYTYRTTVATMNGRFMVPLSAEHRAAAGVTAGDDVEVEVALDIEPRDVVVPGDLTDALAGDDAARRFFDALSHSHRQEWVRWIEQAKRAETRAARISRAVVSLSAGQKVH